MLKGATFIGNLLVDYIKIIDHFPHIGRLCNMGEISRCVGGLAANTPIDLKVLAPELHVASMGMVGNDENGRYIAEKIASYDIDVSGIVVHDRLPTSFTDVMTEQETGIRTFFQQQGAGAAYGYDEVDFPRVKTTHAHVGYALLQERMDSADPVYGTVMAKVLHTLLQSGIRTSMDVVTATGRDYPSVIKPCLPHVDYLFMNEIEAEYTCEKPIRDDDGSLSQAKVQEACQMLLSYGVRTAVILHAPEGGWAMARSGEFCYRPSMRLPAGYIKGSCGAGDAFCAGMLYALIEGLPLPVGLEIANLSSAANLSCSNSIDGMRSLGEMKARDQP